MLFCMCDTQLDVVFHALYITKHSRLPPLYAVSEAETHAPTQPTASWWCMCVNNGVTRDDSDNMTERGQVWPIGRSVTLVLTH